MTPAVKRKAASVMITEFRRSQRRACDLSGLRRSTCRYRSRRSGDDELRQLRLECLDAHWFSTLDDARHTIEDWRLDYNDVRPHSSLAEKTPAEFAAAHRETAA